MRFPVRAWVVLGVLAALVAAGGMAYAAIPGSDGTIHACMLNAAGTVRLIDPSLNAQNLRSHCTSLETEVTWSQRGPAGPPGQQGPPGAADNTVRHISNFMADNGNTVTTPVLSKSGELGKLSLSCGHDAGGGTGVLTFTPAAGGPFPDRVLFYSPQVPGSPTKWNSPADDTFSWADTPGDHLVVEVMIEGLTPNDSATTKPTLTVVHGIVQHFNEYSGCSFYFHVDTSNVNSGETFTPSQF